MNIKRCFGVGTIAILFLLTFWTSSVNACSCALAHPQTHFCQADYVIIMRVIRKSDRLVDNQMVYKIEIKKSYKMTEEAQKTLKHGRISTALSDASCGVNLEVGKLYVVASRGPRLSLCNYIKEYQKMSIIERRGFAGAYRKGCKCDIKYCWGSCSMYHGHSCSILNNSLSKCKTNYGTCVPTVHRTPEGPIRKCNWKMTPPYKACLGEP